MIRIFDDVKLVLNSRRVDLCGVRLLGSGARTFVSILIAASIAWDDKKQI
jgi:hypothetical protein